MLQDVAAGLLVAAAFGYSAWALMPAAWRGAVAAAAGRRTVASASGGRGCGGCSGCADRPEPPPARAVITLHRRPTQRSG